MHAKRLLGFLILIGPGLVVALFLLLLFGASPRPEARLIECGSHLMGIAMAVHLCQEDQGIRPLYPGGRIHPEVVRSWRVAAASLCTNGDMGYNCEESWDSPQNRALWESRYWRYFLTCPSDRDGQQRGTTSYVAVLKDGVERPTFDDVLCFVEIHDSDIPWTEPRDVTVEEACEMLLERQPWPHFGAFHVFLTDGVVELVQPDPVHLLEWFTESGKRWAREIKERKGRERSSSEGERYFDRRPKP